MWIIIQDTDRYGDLAKDLPEEIICGGTKEQAEELAARLSNHYAGCDFIFRVLEPEDLRR